VVTNKVGQGKATSANTRPLDLLATRSNRLDDLLAVQTLFLLYKIIIKIKNT
jgi:hypothetical protein